MLSRNATLPSITIFPSGLTESLANNSNALSAVQDPTSSAYAGAAQTQGFQRARFTFSTGATALAAAPVANSSVNIYFLLPSDGTTTGTPESFCTDLGRTATPVSMLQASIPLDAVNTTQTYASEPIYLPEVPFEVILVNAATGQSFAAGWSLSLIPSTDAEV
jgi:hypothetical protein